MNLLHRLRSLFLLLALGLCLVGFVGQPHAHATDLSVTAANVVPDSGYTWRDMVAGETLTAGQVVYQLSSDGRAYKASTASASAAAIVGIALNGAGAGQPVRVQTGGTVSIGATVTVGIVYCLSDTAGGIAPSADNGSGDYVGVIGIGVTAAKIKLGILVGGVAKP